jgi:hypothetical protein
MHWKDWWEFCKLGNEAQMNFSELIGNGLGRYSIAVILFFIFSISKAYYPFVGDTLDYKISWGPITAGHARLVIKETKSANELEITSRAWNSGIIESLFPVKDTVKSIVSADSLFPRVFDQKISEGAYKRKALTIYNYETKKAVIKDTAFKSSARLHGVDTVITLNGNERCILSAFYLARTLKLEPGDTAYFNAIGGVKKYRLMIICHKREVINTALGKKKCLLIEPLIQGDGLFKAKGKLLIWVTDDKERLPALMRSEIALGSIEASLIGVTR